MVGHVLSISIELPTEWDHSDELVNFDDELFGRRIAQQRTYDKKPLGVAVCYLSLIHI